MAHTQRTVIPGTDLSVFPLNLGGNTFGWTSDRDQTFEVLDAFAAGGGNFIDSADLYSVWAPGNSGGESETLLGQWMAARGNRDQLVIATKVGGLQPRNGQSRATVNGALDESLQRLQTDYVDLYYAHYDDENVSIEDQAHTYDELVTSGKVRHIGLSNYAPARMRHWFEFATAEGLRVPVAIQPQYSLVHRSDYESGYASIAQEFDAAVFSFFSLAAGFLTGKYRTKEDLAGADREAMAEGYFSEDGLKVVEAVAELAQSHEVELPTIALAWLLSKGVTAPIASARTTEQLPALLAAPGVRLTEAEVQTLDEVSAPFA